MKLNTLFLLFVSIFLSLFNSVAEADQTAAFSQYSAEANEARGEVQDPDRKTNADVVVENHYGSHDYGYNYSDYIPGRPMLVKIFTVKTVNDVDLKAGEKTLNRWISDQKHPVTVVRIEITRQNDASMIYTLFYYPLPTVATPTLPAVKPEDKKQ